MGVNQVLMVDLAVAQLILVDQWEVVTHLQLVHLKEEMVQLQLLDQDPLQATLVVEEVVQQVVQ